MLARVFSMCVMQCSTSLGVDLSPSTVHCREVVQETREARERAAVLKKKREEQAERKREMLKAAFIKKQVQKMKAKQSVKQGKPPA